MMSTTVSEANYTCNTCGLSFGAAEYQREHMKTEWHRYNLKRRVADLPPIPSDVFAQKMLQVQQQETQPPTQSRRQVTKKDLRRQEKSARKQEQLQEKVAGMDLSRSSSTTSFSSVGFSAGEPSRDFISASEPSELSGTEFSGTEASDAEDFAAHDQASGPLRAGSQATVEDVDALLKEKLRTYREIPPNVSFMDGHESASTRENVEYLSKKYGLVVPEEDHVADWDGLVGYLNEKVALGNCCLSCTYMGRSLEAVRAHMVGKQHVKIPWDTDEQEMELLDFYDFPEEDEEWEDVGDEADAESVDGESVVSSEAPDGPFIDGYDLVLGSGRTAGHRSLQRYFKQHLPAPKERPGQKAVKLIDYRSPGVTERAADKIVKQEWKENKKAERAMARGRKFQNFQAHYRDQLLQ